MRFALIAAVLVLAGCDLSGGDDARVYIRYPDETPSLAPRSLPTFFDCLRERGQTIISAHRGGARGALPEHALRTFGFTLAHAPAFLEVDVRAARDGLVIMHDETVDRTTGGHGSVADMTVAQIQALTLLGTPVGQHPPSLREALEWAAGETVLELDIKSGVAYEDVVAEVRDAGAMGRVVFITYSVDGASRLARVAPEAMIYTTITNARDLDTLERRGVDLTHIVVWLGDDALDRDLLAALNSRGVEARWGLFDRYADFAEAAEAGVQGVAVNDPAAAYRAIDAADGAESYAALQCVGAN
jgi:glycerophosphoryl diester phosphodiesterase